VTISTSTPQSTTQPIKDLLAAAELPLCVDVDGTLLRTDLLYESVCALLRHRPLDSWRIPLWLLKGKAVLKRELAARVELDPAKLPYHEEVLAFLKSEHQRGRKVFLASASDEKFVTPIAQHLRCCDGVFASNGTINLAGERKRDALNDHFGKGGYAYAGNDSVDLPVWRDAGSRIVVSSNARVIEQARQEFELDKVFPGGGKHSVAVVLKALRVHQWVKNLLLFLPVIMAHMVFEIESLLAIVAGFFAFSTCASSVYLLNDLVDLEADRVHRSKRNRPFASGTLPLIFGFLAVPVLLAISLSLSLLLPLGFLVVLSIYYVTTMAYSFGLKRVVLLDIITLALLYAVRVLAGGQAAQVPVSQWLLAFSLFMFVSLAAVKRFSELYALRAQNRPKTEGRGYLAEDLDQIAQFGSASGYISVLVMALYVSSADVTKLYSHPQALWLVCPVLLYWVSRVWLLAHRGQMDEDPIVFALRDRVSYVVGALILAMVFIAM
jgi:4-hydroxybenzoate polyprenyltransferase